MEYFFFKSSGPTKFLLPKSASFKVFSKAKYFDITSGIRFASLCGTDAISGSQGWMCY